MTTVNSDIYAYNHNGQNIKVHWSRDTYDEKEYTDRIEFNYKDVDVSECYNDKKNVYWYDLTGFMCNIIDKIGKDKFDKFKNYYNECEILDNEYIILDNKIYKPYINTFPYGRFTYYIIEMKMKDGRLLDGKSNIDIRCTSPYYIEECNKDKLISMLKYRVKQYYKEKKIPPEGEYLLKEETEKYNKILQWFEENKIKSYVLNFISN
ncbi:hypothetical protein [Clostridium tyrobutyricum]|uniref:hypothetical protein n=1 Tax=Clostridium tyrobutyricum TaxID=1519 RepID=UPI0010AA4A70|nr:hypothetical protein [Clostridium tyrobutyricum]QCH28013.1 hypothetical protein EZN00_01614 [Clostridium tyrobutyricum]